MCEGKQFEGIQTCHGIGKLSLACLLFVASSPNGRRQCWLIRFVPRVVYLVTRFEDFLCVAVQFC